MIGMKLVHSRSGERGTIDAEVGQPDGTLLVRLNDRWFAASDMVAVPCGH